MNLLISSLVMLFFGFLLGFIVRSIYEKKSVNSQSSKVQELLTQVNKKQENLIQEKERFESKKEEDSQIRKLKQEELDNLKKNLSLQQDRLFKAEKVLDENNLKLDQREKKLNTLETELDVTKQKLEEKREQIASTLENIAQMSKEEAAHTLMSQLESSMTKDMASLISKKEEEARDKVDQITRNIVLSNISRLATEITAESVVSSVSLPNDEMKGRIIGREGRNIRSLETKTGVDVIIDDTPEAIIISSFDPVRREVARLTIERLISDGRIQPSRIEEIHDKVREEIKDIIKQEGEAACYKLGIHNIHPDMKNYIGRMKYRTSYGQNLLLHSIEVAQLASMIAGDLGLDRELAKRGGLLHDIGKVIMDDDRGHVMAGADLAKQFGETEQVLNCIMAHHEEFPHSTPESMIVRLADAISAARPGARRDSFERYIERLENLENIALQFKEIEKAYAIQAGRELRVIVNSAETSDEESKILARNIADQIESNLRYPGQIRVSILRETRFVEYAK